jgi:hypothetical protein
MVDAADLLRRPVENDNAAMESEPPTVEPPKRKRRWFQFSLRTLLVVVALIAVGCFWFGVKMRDAAKQKTAVEGILKDGGWVEYSYEVDATGNAIAGAEPPVPAWMRKLFGDDFFWNVVGANVKTDTGMESVAQLPELRLLWLAESKITDSGLQHASALAHLDDLCLYSTSVSDMGLKHIRQLQELRTLDISGTDVSDAGLSELESLGELRELIVNATRVTDSGLRNLKALNRLETLDVRFTAVTKDGSADFQRSLPSCRIER